MKSIASWNVRGAGSRSFPSMIRDFCSRHCIDVLIVLEPRISGPTVDKVILKLGFDHHVRVDATGFSGGIWLLWKDTGYDVVVVKSTKQILHIRFNQRNGGDCWELSCVYGSPRGTERVKLWDDLREIAYQISNPWLLMGDFNVYLDIADKQGGGEINFNSMWKFQDCVQQCNLLDLGFHGPRFTWEGRGIKERLDRALCNCDWQVKFPDCNVTHLPALKSDHRPILLKLSQLPNHPKHKPFRFMANWLSDATFERVVQDSWRNASEWNQIVKDFHVKASEWNRNHFGNIFHKKRRILARLDGIDMKRAVSDSRGLQKLQQKLFKMYQDILDQEDLFWYQRARQDWIKFGDRNTRFFHLSTTVRKCKNCIESLQNNDGETIEEPKALEQMTVSFFSNLYKAEGDINVWNLRGNFPAINRTTLAIVEAMPLDCEVKEAMFSMGSLKAPGPDGLHPLFFQSQWDIVGPKVCEVVREAFSNPEKIHSINETLLVLIPKVEGPSSLKQFRLISLCNVIYKTITKIIANRLQDIMPLLVGPQQCSFIKGRQSTDNIIIAQEVFHSMHIRKGSKGYMAVKVDLDKAYDRLRWEFILDTLKDIGFEENFINLIYHCISSSVMQVLFNGNHTTKFSLSQGVRQGDPISPYLFVLTMERLAHLIQSKVDAKEWKPVVLSKGGPPISHLFFADDLILFGEASMQQMNIISDCLTEFCGASGARVSIEKTRLLVSSNVNSNRARDLSIASGFGLSLDFGKYLGVPIIHARKKNSLYEYIIDKVRKRLSSWKAKNLTFAGRITLTQSVLAALPTYVMQTTLLPQGVCNKIEKLMRNFIWGSADENHR
ncbi:hypothetical protein P8452_51955 [Trifolium repens]|nr:hypothetical protein P8452_51955 [Trifolium repens]